MNSIPRVLKPWKATSLDEIRSFHKYLSRKIDGIRCWTPCVNNVHSVLTASNKLIPNRHIREILSRSEYANLDGELTCGTFRETTSAVMSEDGKPDFEFQVFDTIDIGKPYHARWADLYSRTWTAKIHPLHTTSVNTRSEIERFLGDELAFGAEGICLRDPNALWRPGRCPHSSEALVAIKPLADAEATIVGFEEQMHNTNEATINERGLITRSLAAAGRIPAGTLGALKVIGITAFHGLPFDIGTGFSDALRAEIWANRPLHLGAVVRYRYLPVGGYDLPRQPRFLGFRDLRDI